MAGKIPEETVAQVRAAVNIADYIGQYVQLHSAGQNLFGLCPFHDENTGSFSVNESKQIFKCFSCGRGGNVFSFVMDYDKLSFPEAVAKVAAYANMPLHIDVSTQTKAEDPQITAQKSLLQKISDLCHHILVNTEIGQPALDYLTKRGLTQATIDHFDIGYAPQDRQLMRKFLDNQGVDYATQRASGLFTEDADGQLFDRFNDRVMFPLKDVYGNVIGFSGRVLTPGNQAKYLNSPETALFNKRDVLFNLDGAKNEFKQFGSAVLFEGFMDVIAAYQAGVPVGIASMGTSLTKEQVGIIAHHTRTLTICYDGDAPGQKATARALELVANQPRLTTQVVALPDGMDPDEYIKARGAQAFVAQVQTVLTPSAFRLNYLAMGRDMQNNADKLAYLDDALKIVAQAGTAATQAVYLQQIEALTGVSQSALQASLPQAAPPVADAAPYGTPPPEPEEYGQPYYPDHFGATTAAPSAPKFDKFERAERTLLAQAYAQPIVARRLHTSDFHFAHAAYQTLFDAWCNYISDHADGAFAGYLDTVPPDLVQTATDLSMMQLPESDESFIDDLIARVQEESVYAQLQQVKQALHQAQQLGDKLGATKLSVQYIQLMRAYKTNSDVE